jgi:hypothetical protein
LKFSARVALWLREQHADKVAGVDRKSELEIVVGAKISRRYGVGMLTERDARSRGEIIGSREL